MSWITSLMMASGWSCAENAQAKAHDDDDDDDDDGEKKTKSMMMATTMVMTMYCFL